MSLGHGASISTSGLRSVFDKSNIKSYSGSGNAWTDIIRRQTYTNTHTVGAGSESWMGSESSEITISLVLKKLGTFVGYAEHPVNKWSGTWNASFVLYHFGTTGLTDMFMWYGNRGGTWAGLSSGFYGTNGSTYAMTLQYNNTLGGQLWINGVKSGNRTGSGARADTTAPLIIFGPVGSSTVSVENFYMWNRELSDIEIQQNFNALRGRYGI